MAPRKPDANDLRFAGEAADSIRGEPAFLVLDDKGIPEIAKAGALGNRKPLLELLTDLRGPGIQTGAKVQFILDGKPYTKEIPHFDEADCVFLTQSSIEKFLLPYYMRFKSANEVGALENTLFNDKDVVAAFHIPGSITHRFSRVGVVTRDKTTGECDCKVFPDE